MRQMSESPTICGWTDAYTATQRERHTDTHTVDSMKERFTGLEIRRGRKEEAQADVGLHYSSH